MSDHEVKVYSDVVVQKIINRNITRAWWLMQGQGGYYKKSTDHLTNLQFPYSYSEFREEAKAESGLIYCEAIESYDPDHFKKTGKGEGQIKFTSWLYWKLRDLDGRLWRLASSGCSGLDKYVDYGMDSRFEDEFIFRDSLSIDAQHVLAMLETGQGFKLKKSREYDKANCHMGVRTFWESFIRDGEAEKMTFRQFLEAWNEIRKAWTEIETDSMVYTILDNQTA